MIFVMPFLVSLAVLFCGVSAIAQGVERGRAAMAAGLALALFGCALMAWSIYLIENLPV